ncbi:MAG: hypothetical protein N2C14_21140 [Planctomycetales bacterium]
MTSRGSVILWSILTGMEPSDSPSNDREPTTPASRPTRRRWLTYSLRSLVAAMFIACMGFAWFGFHWRAKQKERAAVKALEELGGTVYYDYQLNEDGVRLDPPSDAPGAEWLRTLLGDDWFAEVQGVSAVFSYNPHFSKTGLTHVRELKQLRSLEFEDLEITDPELLLLRELNQLRTLGLSGTPVTDAGLIHLRELRKLQRLDLRRTQVSDVGLVHLRELKQLQELRLDSTQVRDTGLVHLHELNQLQELGLSSTQVTDAGLLHLREMKQLTKLWIDYTFVTHEGVVALRKALPNCDVRY